MAGLLESVLLKHVFAGFHRESKSSTHRFTVHEFQELKVFYFLDFFLQISLAEDDVGKMHVKRIGIKKIEFFNCYSKYDMV